MSMESATLIQMLLEIGVPEEHLNQGQFGLLTFVKNNKSYLPKIVNALLPNHLIPESMLWLQWLMFEDEPQRALGHLSNQKRSVCGAITRRDDTAYRCLTCDLNPISGSTVMLCVSCFQNGNHEGHDFRVLNTSDGGCCDCGDVTALRREGFCSNHEGTDHMLPLPAHVAASVGPVLDIMLGYWKNNPLLHEFTSTLTEMLLDFCKCSESLLSFIAVRVCSAPGLLDSLLRVESVMSENVVVKLHELLLTLFVEPTFKYEFAKAFTVYYPSVVNLAIREGGDAVFNKCPLLSMFSVQIFTVPILTTRLVEEMDLLGLLFQCLETIINYCAGEDGRMQVAKWISIYETILRVSGDIDYVMSHSGVPKHLCHCRRELVTKLIRFLTFAQGIDSQKRETDSCIEDGNENVCMPFLLCYSLSHVFSFLVTGAFSVSSNEESQGGSSFGLHNVDCDYDGILRHSEAGRQLQESSIGIVAGKGVLGHERKASYTLPIPPSALWLTHECLQSMQYWLKMDNIVGDLNESDSLSSVSQWPNISYDISSQDISVHIPLHRGLALVIHRSIREWCAKSEPDGDFFGYILEGSCPYGFSAYVMEHPLRIRVFCAQVKAGMWKMNGFAPIFCSETYRYMCRYELGQGLDLFLLQCCAALAPPDLYIQRILERFGLSNYFSLNREEQHTEHEPILLAEMLTLLVQIVTERRYCGQTTVESVQRELIHKLSVRNTTREKLVNFFPGDLLSIKQLQEVLDTVADLSHPSDTTEESVYELRSSYWKQLDLYHPCWKPSDRKAALIRYKRVCQVSALTTQVPKWTNIYDPLKRIAKLATCKTFLQIIRSVLFNAVTTTSRVPDDALITALHLLSLSFDVCRSHKKSGDLVSYVDDVLQLLDFVREEIFVVKNGNQSMWSLLILLKTTFLRRTLDENLLLNIRKSFVEIEYWLARLQKENPILFADKSLPTGQPFSDYLKCNPRSRKREGAVFVEKMKSMKLSNEDEEMNDYLNQSKGHLDPETD